MAVCVLSDIHADAEALSRVIALLCDRRFCEVFGGIDGVVCLGDILGRGHQPEETLQRMQALSEQLPVTFLLGNHDDAYLRHIPVSGGDRRSGEAHEGIRESPLLSMIRGMKQETVIDSMLFVHGGPLRLGGGLTEQPFWQRLSTRPGPSFSGYHYTAEMAFEELDRRGLSHLCIGHQHTPICCRKDGGIIKRVGLDFIPLTGRGIAGECACIDLNDPTIIRVGACMGNHPEIGITDFRRFFLLRLSADVCP
ncbi:metallophosphoesterase family protein [Methanofollis fontis]|uniref:Metallophosphoesterase n=1 Tax=Methanofollis fontis TaxID=2052832 RepID=A0A483CSR2_9EURY|nr:metallophosphoesterase [Methanofollis fontis]TAJ44241.1 metallophosphoesterase [Methanofollis fontis]